MIPIGVESKAQALDCPVRTILSNVTGKWRIIVIVALED